MKKIFVWKIFLKIKKNMRNVIVKKVFKLVFLQLVCSRWTTESMETTAIMTENLPDKMRINMSVVRLFEENE